MEAEVKPLVLCYGRDESLLGLRAGVLSRCFETMMAHSTDDIATVEPPRAFAAIVLCHTLSNDECSDAMKITAQRWPEAKVIALTAPFRGCPDDGQDMTFLRPTGPVELLHGINQVLTEE